MSRSKDTKQVTILQDGKSRVVEVDVSLPSDREQPDAARADIRGWMASTADIQSERLSFPTSENAATLGSGSRTTNAPLEHQHAREVGLRSR
jgi:hypothetical protein